jgi:Fe-S-cluster containining protein
MRHALCAMLNEATLAMKYIDLDKLKEIPGRRIEAEDTFSFRCYPGIGCFNRCCRNLNLFLYPYDVLRLKKALGISSDEFLDQYVEVLLRMSTNEEKNCTFLIESGCSVYADRPGTCRMFPMEHGVIYDAALKKDKPVYFFRPPDFCLGPSEDKQWTVSEWAEDQDAGLYQKMTMYWTELKRLFLADPWGTEGPEGSKAKMAFMATYNIDRFREFVFNSSFLKRYKVKSAILKKIQNDDGELLKFGFDWVKLFIWGIKSKKIRPR